jgi:hypothetical protein
LYICCGDFVFSLWFLTSGIRAISLADIVGKYFLFLQICFSEKKKEGRNIIEIFGTQFQKKNPLKQSLGSEFMSILNSTVFQGFSGKRRNFLQ